MSSSLECIAYLSLVALLWGVTNPFMKKGAQGLENVKSSTRVGQFFKEVAFLLTNMKHLIPFLINQCGSVLYILTLSYAEISLAVPVTNSLTSLITAVTGWILGEEKVHRNTYIGIVFILFGTFLCCWDKMNTDASIS